MATVRIAILAYPGCFASEVFGVLDVLTIGRHVAGGADLDARDPDVVAVEVAGVRSSPRIETSGGVDLVAPAPSGPPDVVVVPGFEPRGARTDIDGVLAGLRPEIEFVRGAHEAGAQVVSVCVGAFLLAEAGLLDGRRATTSWVFARALAERSPTTELQVEELVVRDGGVTTTAAFSAMYDFTLQLLAEQRGADVARRTARVALLDDARGSQTPYVDGELLPPAGSSFGAGVQRWLRHHLDEPFDLRRVAAEFNVSPRTLTRRFAAETGQSALRYLQSQRVRRAQHLLTTTQQPVAEVARRVGYGDAATFSQLFRRTVGLAPRDYRAQFGAVGRPLR